MYTTECVTLVIIIPTLISTSQFTNFQIMYNFTYPIICMGKLRLILPGSFPGAGEPGLNPPRVLGYA